MPHSLPMWSAENVDKEALLAACGARLPRYMVPAVIVKLPQLPPAAQWQGEAAAYCDCRVLCEAMLSLTVHASAEQATVQQQNETMLNPE